MANIIQRNNVVVTGDGPQTLLLAHGFGCDQRMWRRVIPHFTSTHRVVTFDYVGAGRSDRSAYTSERYRTFRGYSQDILEVCDALSLNQVIFIGHSASSMIGMQASFAEPERFARMVMVTPSPRYLNDPPHYVGGFERSDIEQLFDLMDQNFIGWASTFADVAAEQPELARELSESFCSTDPRTAREFAEAVFWSDHRAELPQITVPSLIVQCSDDDICPISVGEYMHRHIPRSTLRLMNVSGHLPHMSHPEETAALIKEYLDQPPPQS